MQNWCAIFLAHELLLFVAARRGKYKVDPNQELLAYGLIFFIISSCFEETLPVSMLSGERESVRKRGEGQRKGSQRL